MADESAAHALGGAKTGIGRDRIKRHVAVGEAAAGFVEAGALDELRRGDAGLLGEAAGETALAHGGARRQRRDREIGTGIFNDEGADTGQARVGDTLGGELRRKLRLAAGSHRYIT